MKPLFTPTAQKPKVVDENARGIVTMVSSKEVGSLSPIEQQTVLALKQELVNGGLTSLVAFGSKLGDNFSKISDKVLEHATVADIDFLNTHMTQIMLQTQSLNVQAMNAPPSSIPLIGGFIDRIKNVKAKVTSQYAKVNDQIQKSLEGVDLTISNITTQGDALEQMYLANTEEYRSLRYHVIAAKMRYEEVDAETNAFAKTLTVESDPFDHQQVADARRYLNNLDMTITNFEVMGTDAILTAKMIREAQQNAVLLVDKFGMVKKFTYPNWKKKFGLALITADQLKAATLANAIDDANNELVRNTATALKQSSVKIAKLSQRGVLDVATLEFVNTEMYSAAEEVARVTADGAKQRKELVARAEQMKQQLLTNRTKEVKNG